MSNGLAFGRIRRLDIDLDTPPSNGGPVIIHNYKPPPTFCETLWNLSRSCKLCIFLIAGATLGLTIFFALGDSHLLSFTASGLDVISNDTKPTNFPSASPTEPATTLPSRAPTFYPTTEPPIIETPRPTRPPSFSPTFAPVAECTTPDAVCGCNLVVSEVIDVIFLVDESGSVGAHNYGLMTQAISTFAKNVYPPMNPLNGTRIGYIEFSDNANEIIELADFSTATAFVEKLSEFSYTGGATDHRRALLKAHAMMKKERNAIRKGSQLAVVMLTDGNPCVRCGRICCVDSFKVAKGTNELRNFRKEFNFTFYFLPIVPSSGALSIDLKIFNAALGPKDGTVGLSQDEFITFEPQGFGQLEQFLNGETFTFPLGPCVKPPTVSSGDRLLLSNEAGNIEEEAGIILK